MKKSGKKISFFKKSGNNHGTPQNSIENILKIQIYSPTLRSPVVDLAEQQGIDTLLLPLSWWDMYPHQLAHSNQDAWARGLQVEHILI